jgi:hypothetical protein
MKFKTRVMSGHKSAHNKNKTLLQIAMAKLERILLLLMNYPYVVFLEKNSLVYENGVFDDMKENSDERVPFLRPKRSDKGKVHINAKQPADWARLKMEDDYGLCLPWPPFGFLDIIQTAVRDTIKSLLKNKDSRVFIPFKHFFDEDGNVTKTSVEKREAWHSSMIKGWVVINKDYAEEVVKYAFGDDSKPTLKYYLMDAGMFGPEMISEQAEKHQKIHKSKMLELDNVGEASNLLLSYIPSDKLLEFRSKLGLIEENIS